MTASASKARFSAQFFKKKFETHQNKSEAGGNFKTFTERESFPSLQLGEIYRDLQKQQQSKVKARDM